MVLPNLLRQPPASQRSVTHRPCLLLSDPPPHQDLHLQAKSTPGNMSLPPLHWLPVAFRIKSRLLGTDSNPLPSGTNLSLGLLTCSSQPSVLPPHW